MPKSKHRKNRRPAPKPPAPPTMADYVAGRARFEFTELPRGHRCDHCNGGATVLVTVWARGRPWPAPACAEEAARLREFDAWIRSTRPTS